MYIPFVKLSEAACAPNDDFANAVALGVSVHDTPFPSWKAPGFGGRMRIPWPAAPVKSGRSPVPNAGCLHTGPGCVLCSAHGLLGLHDGGGTMAGGGIAPVGNMGLGVAGNCMGGNGSEEAAPPGVDGASPVVLGAPALACACAVAAATAEVAAASPIMCSFCNLATPAFPNGLPSLVQAYLS